MLQVLAHRERLDAHRSVLARHALLVLRDASSPRAYLREAARGGIFSRVNVSWPTAFVLSVLTVSVSVLVYKGAVPSHVLSTVGGAILGYLVRRPTAAISKEPAP
jgi:hypothetical protein